MIILKNKKGNYVNEGIRNISKNFVEERKIDESIKNEIAKDFPVNKPKQKK